MDRDGFDTLTRVLASGLSRRQAALALATGLAASIPGAVIPDGAQARKRRKRKKPRPACPACGECHQCQSGRCVPSADDTLCRDCGRCLNGVCANALDRAPACGLCARCEAGACVNRPVNSPCDGSAGLCTLPAVCYDGACNEGVCYFPPPPFCTAISDACTADNECCSGTCCRIIGTEVRFCCQSAPGGRCLTDGDCVEGASCVAYRCYT